MRTSLFIILILSRTFFAIYNLVLIVGAVFGFYPLTIFSGIYTAHISRTTLRLLLGIPGFIMGMLSTFLLNSRIRGIVNALFASLLVVVEINFSLVASYILAREFRELASVFYLGEPIYASSVLGAIFSKKVGS